MIGGSVAQMQGDEVPIRPHSRETLALESRLRLSFGLPAYFDKLRQYTITSLPGLIAKA